MSATEILEQFRRLPFEEKRELVERIREEFGEELPPEQIALFEERAERLRRHPERGITWEKVRAELKKRPARQRVPVGK